MSTYHILRKYRDGHPSELIAEDLTLEEAQEHCSDPETSSRTCTTTEGITRTNLKGPWFDAYYED